MHFEGCPFASSRSEAIFLGSEVGTRIDSAVRQEPHPPEENVDFPKKMSFKSA